VHGYLALIRKVLKRRDYRRLLLSLPEILAVRSRLWLRRRDYGQILAQPCSAALRSFLRWRERTYERYFQLFTEALAGAPSAANPRGGVLLLVGTLGPGGAERQAAVTLLGLARRGVRPVALAAVRLESETKRFFLPRLEAMGLDVAELNRDPIQDTIEPLSHIRRATAVLPYRLGEVMNYARTLVKHNPQIAHLWLDEVNIQGGLAAVAAGVPRIVLHVRSLPPHHFAFYKTYMLEAYRWLAAHPAVILAANSLAGARAYEEWIGLPRGRIQVIHNGFDFDNDLSPVPSDLRLAYRMRHGIPADAPVVGTVIRFSHEKRPELWLRTAERIAHALPDAHFLMVGDGHLRHRLAKQAKRSFFGGRVHMVGYEKSALNAISAMDLFLLTSHIEGLPNVLIEAQAMGVPVVTTPAGGAAETLMHGHTGWLLEDARSDAAAAVIVRLLTDQGWLRQARKDAREFVRERFGVERMLDETLGVYGYGSHPPIVEQHGAAN